MPNYLPFMLVVTLWIYAFVDCLGTPPARVRGLPKVVWVLVVLFFGEIMLGPLAWLLVGKRRSPAMERGAPADWHREYRELRERREQRHPRQGGDLALDRFHEPDPEWVAPDDNPEFLRSLSELNKQRRKDGTSSPEGE
jgi:hypothetical protein